jgi:voltage-gated potassium channel Kch
MISSSFAVSPVLINLGYKLTDRVRATEAPEQEPALVAASDLVIVVGYGPVGRAICFMLERAKIAYVVFEEDLERVREASKQKHNVRYGDVADPTMMDSMAIARARAVVVTTSSYEATKRLIGNLRSFHPATRVMTAVPYLSQRDELERLGAVQVMALLPEGTLSFGRSVLDSLGIPTGEAGEIIGSLHANDYAVLRGIGGVQAAVAIARTPAVSSPRKLR